MSSASKAVWIFLFAITLAVSAPVSPKCDDSGMHPPGSDYWSIQIENDYFVLAGDRHYTQGTQVSRLVPGTGPDWLEALAEWLPFYHLNEKEAATNYSLGQKIFTPVDLDSTSIIPDDRPYAGYLYFSAALISRFYRSKDLETGNILEISFGLVGPGSGAAASQEYFHDIFDSEVPMGWGNQLANEPGLGLSYTRAWNMLQPGPGSIQLGITPHMTAQLGNVYTYGAGGVMLRVGNNLRDSLSPPNIRPGFPGISYFKVSSRLSWYLFAGHESRIVLRDIFLDGNTFRKSHSVEKEVLVGDHQFGFAMHKGKTRVALSNMLRTREFEGQDKLTRYGALNISFTF